VDFSDKKILEVLIEIQVNNLTSKSRRTSNSLFEKIMDSIPDKYKQDTLDEIDKQVSKIREGQEKQNATQVKTENTQDLYKTLVGPETVNKEDRVVLVQPTHEVKDGKFLRISQYKGESSDHKLDITDATQD
jgi:hypothetical protein